VSFLKVSLAALFLSQSAFANPICSSVLLDSMVETKAAVLKPGINYQGYKLVPNPLIKAGITKKSPEFKAALSELVRMFSDTLYTSAGEKVSLEKGELYLAKRIDDDTTLELSYQGDLRSSVPAFRLIKVALVKGNAQSVSISKEPLVDSGKGLKIKSFILQSDASAQKTLLGVDVLNAIEAAKYNGEDPLLHIDMLIAKAAPSDRVALQHISDSKQNIEVPLVIEGDLLKSFVSLAENLNLMERGKIRQYVDKNKLGTLVALSRAYASYDFTKQVAKKQIYKYMLVGAAFYGIAMLLRDDVSNTVEKKVDELAIQSKMSKDDLMELYLLFSDQYQPWHDESPALSERLWDSVSIMGPMEKMETFKKFREDLGRALIKEYKNNSEVQFYFVDNNGFGKVTETNEKAISELEGGVNNKQELLFIHLPLSKKLFVGVLRHSDKKGKVESIAYTVVSKKEASNLYEILLKEIHDGIKRSLPAQPTQILDK